MPSCTPEVRAAVERLFPDADALDVEALRYLIGDCGFTCEDGLIRAPIGHHVTEEEAACLDYLWQEWDYAFEGER